LKRNKKREKLECVIIGPMDELQFTAMTPEQRKAREEEMEREQAELDKANGVCRGCGS
jgi:hypothetical protein